MSNAKKADRQTTESCQRILQEARLTAFSAEHMIFWLWHCVGRDLQTESPISSFSLDLFQHLLQRKLVWEGRRVQFLQIMELIRCNASRKIEYGKFSGVSGIDILYAADKELHSTYFHDPLAGFTIVLSKTPQVIFDGFNASSPLISDSIMHFDNGTINKWTMQVSSVLYDSFEKNMRDGFKDDHDHICENIQAWDDFATELKKAKSAILFRLPKNEAEADLLKCTLRSVWDGINFDMLHRELLIDFAEAKRLLDEGCPLPTQEEARGDPVWLLIHRRENNALSDTEHLNVNDDSERLDQYVTLDMMAAAVNRQKRTLERWINKDHNAPLPDVQGGGGRSNEWIWSKIRSWLENKSGKKLPNRFPSFRKQTDTNRH